VDHAENTIQSIFLEEMESFPGNIIVTTNLCAEMDVAMSRQRDRDPGMMPLAMEWRSVGVLTPFITNKVHGIYQLSESCKDGILDLPTP